MPSYPTYDDYRYASSAKSSSSRSSSSSSKDKLVPPSYQSEPKRSQNSSMYAPQYSSGHSSSGSKSKSSSLKPAVHNGSTSYKDQDRRSKDNDERYWPRSGYDHRY